MSDPAPQMRTLAHSTFVIERLYDAAPSRVFKAFSDQKAKDLWFGGPEGWTCIERTFDFREGGRERLAGVFPDGKISLFDCLYYDIVPNERIVFAYEMEVNGARFSVSLTTVELTAEAGKTRLTFTEQGVFMTGVEAAEGREHGTKWLLDKLGASLTEPVEA